MKKRKLPGPSAHRKECWKDMYKMAPDAQEYVTNGHFLLKTDKVPKRALKTEAHSFRGLIKFKDFKPLLNKPTKAANLKYYAFYDPDVGKGVSANPIGLCSDFSDYKAFVVFESRWWENSCRSGAWLEMVETARFNQGYINIIRNRFSNATFGLDENAHQLTVFENGKPIGIVMAIYGCIESCYDMAREMGYIE